jgi:hypothetical protein
VAPSCPVPGAGPAEPLAALDRMSRRARHRHLHAHTIQGGDMIPPRRRHAIALAISLSGPVSACGGEDLFEQHLRAGEVAIANEAVLHVASDNQNIAQAWLVGDLDGDGKDDAIIRVTYRSDQIIPRTNDYVGGALYVLYGGTATGEIYVTRLPSLTADPFGYGLIAEPAGDLDGDGLADVLLVYYGGNACHDGVTASEDEKHNTAYVLYGGGTRLAGATPVASIAARLRDPVPCTSSVDQVASLGDIDGDGKADFAMGGGPVPDRGVPQPAPMYVFYGRGERLAGTIDLRAGADAVLDLTLEQLPGLYGLTYVIGGHLARAGDVDGDGRGDVFLDAPGGGTRLVRGSATRWSGTVTIDQLGGTTFRREALDRPTLGVTALGDLDGDGVDDFALQSYPVVNVFNVGVGPNRPTVQHLFYGRHGGFPAQLDLTAADAMFSSSTPTALSTLTALASGDLDGDGVPDLVMGDTSDDGGNGGVTVFPGNGSRWTGNTVFGGQEKIYVGRSKQYPGCSDAHCLVHESVGAALGVGDVTGDGRADVLVNAPSEPPWEASARLDVRGSGTSSAYLLAPRPAKP